MVHTGVWLTLSQHCGLEWPQESTWHTQISSSWCVIDITCKGHHANVSFVQLSIIGVNEGNIEI